MPNTVFANLGQARDSLKANKFAYTTWDKTEHKAKTTTNTKADAFLEGYATIAAFLCDGARFQAALSTVSGHLWDAYRLFQPKTRNKFTRALNKVAAAKGFDYQNRFTADTSHAKPIGVKLIGGDPQLGYMLRNKLFWKDSMDLHHGEHSHSLQWLAIAEGLPNLVPSAAALYAETGNFRAPSQSDKSGDRSLLMWQWLADCFPSSMSRYATEKFLNNETLESQSYRSPQVITDYLIHRGQPIAGDFVSTYLFFRYKNRNWLSTKEVWGRDGTARTELDKIYTGDASASRHGSVGATTWKPSPSVPAARLIRDPAKYVGKHDGDAVREYELVLHGQPGTLCYFYAE
jgi:hypothetical protein